MEKITQSGFHLVPKSSAAGDFRLSFSCAETRLIRTLSPLQHKVIRAFKAVVKYHQNIWNPPVKEIISSYYLKTIAFWHFEKTSKEFWTKETLVHHIVTLLHELAEALRVQNLPMYFMPKVNLLQEVDDPAVMLNLIENFSQLSLNFSAMSEAINTASIEASIFLNSDNDIANRVNILDAKEKMVVNIINSLASNFTENTSHLFS